MFNSRMPVSPNGVIAGYRLYYMTKQVTDVVTVKDTAEEVVYRLNSLSKWLIVQQKHLMVSHSQSILEVREQKAFSLTSPLGYTF